MKLLSPSEVASVSAGHDGGSTIMFVLGLAHVFIGLVECTNYLAGLWYEGVQEGDYFGAYFRDFFVIEE